MSVKAFSADTGRRATLGASNVRFNSNSRFHRIVSSCVVALLTANAFAIAMIVADDEPETSEESPARTLTLITTADGRRYLVDPNTDAGRAAIADAQRNGGTITQVPNTSSTIVASEKPGTGITLPPNGILPVDPGTILDDTLTTLLGTVSTVSSIVDKSVSTVSSVLGSTQSTVSSIVGSTQSTIANVSTTVDGVVTTVSSTVGGVVTTVSTTVGGVVTTVTVPGPVTSLLGSTDSGTTPTTTAGTDPICTLLAC